MSARWIWVAVACLTASFTVRAQGDDAPLMPGKAAPPIAIHEFIKGEPVKQLEAGKVYVVEFWATWCGPCLESIPHLTELQKKNSDVVFLGISLDEDAAEVKSFVKEMGDKMDYRVGIDTRTKDAKEGVMYGSWLTASKQDGIPVAFIVNKEGKLAWIGHPGELEEPLSLILAGKWDLEAEAKKHAELIAAKQQAEALEGEFTAAIEAKKYKQALELIDKALATSPQLEPDWALSKLWLLILLKQTEPAVEYGNRVVDEVYTEDASQLLVLAGLIVRPNEFAPFQDESDSEEANSKAKAELKADSNDASDEKVVANGSKTKTPSKIDPKLIELAVRAAELAAELSEDIPDVTLRTTISEVLAAGYVANGNKDKATHVLEGQLQELQKQLTITKAAMTMIRSQLKDLDDKPTEQAPTEKNEKKTEDESPK